MIGIGDLKPGGISALQWDCKKLCVPPGMQRSLGKKEYIFPVHSKTAGIIAARVPGKPFGDPAFYRQEKNIGIPVILGTESNLPSIGRKEGPGLHPFIHRKSFGLGSVKIGNPEIIGIDKSNVAVADGGLTHQPGIYMINTHYPGRQKQKTGGHHTHPDRADRHTFSNSHSRGFLNSSFKVKK